MSPRIDWLARLRGRGALLEGHFALSSGLHSPHYVQCARLLQWPEDAAAAAMAIVDALRPSIGHAPDAIVSPAIGGLVLGHEVGRAWGCRALWAERDAEGALGFRRGFELVAGERVVAVEDVVTTAGSLRELFGRCEAAGATVVGVAALVDRSAGAVGWDVPATALVELEGVQVPPDRCPQCAGGLPLDRPGSRPAPGAGRAGGGGEQSAPGDVS